MSGINIWSKKLVFSFVIISFGSYAQPGQFEEIESNLTQINFVNRVQETNLYNIFHYEYLYNGAGIAAGDINNDGLTDLYFVSNFEENKLYLNKGNFYFNDITETAGVAGKKGYDTGVTMVDINNDGWLDIYICKSGFTDVKMRENELWINNGDLTFTEKGAEYGLNDAGFSYQAYFFDMDKDGDLDLYLINQPANLKESNNIKVRKTDEGKTVFYTTNDLKYSSDKIYKNTDGKFKDVSKESGIQNEAFGLSAVVADFNGDSHLDVYVCNDFVQPDYLYINNGKGIFVDSFDYYFKHSSFSSMGSDYADINNDGFADLLALDMVPRENARQKTLSMDQNYDKYMQMLDVGLKAQFSTNCLQLNNGNKSFSDIAHLSGLAYTDWSWTPLIADFDNDGWKDVFITNGLMRDLTNNDYRRYISDSIGKVSVIGTDFLKLIEHIPVNKVKNMVFRNNKDLSFSDVTEEWGTGKANFSCGAIYADLNNDGYLDIVTNNINEKPTILMNYPVFSRPNHYIKIKLKDPGKKTTYGAEVRVYDRIGDVNKVYQNQFYYPTRGYMSSVEPILNFGVYDKKLVFKIVVIWPDGQIQTLYDTPSDQLFEIVKENSGIAQEKIKPNFLFSDVSSQLHSEMKHIENDYIDFKLEPLLYQKFSTEGPGVAVGDVNNDKLDDVFIGGSTGFSSTLFVQNNVGRFEKSNVDFSAHASQEDVNAVFFDINNDGFEDLWVVTGGNEAEEDSDYYLDRIYINNQKGGFIYNENALPKIRQSGKTISVLDIDGDGYLDVFLGGRISPQRYPVSPSSYLLRNNKGVFEDYTEKWSVGLKNTGMVTDSKFSDVDHDGVPELIICGEWMPISIFKKVNGKFVNKTEEFGLSNELGLWQTIELKDVNNDSIPEIFAGNMGLNTFFKASKDKPLSLHYKDYDKNGTIDPIICMYNPKRSQPVLGRDRLLDQMTFLKKRVLRYETYSKMDLSQMFSQEEREGEEVLKVTNLASSIFVLTTDKKYRLYALPNSLQISPIKSVNILDEAGEYVMFAGNFYGTDAQFGRSDASIGAVLKNINGEYKALPYTNTGLHLQGDVRKVYPVRFKSGMKYLVSTNNGQFMLLEKIMEN